MQHLAYLKVTPQSNQVASQQKLLGYGFTFHTHATNVCGSYTMVGTSKSHFTHETKGMWPLHFKHSHWWKRRSQSKFASHYAWGTNKVCECTMDVKSTWIPTCHQMDHVSCLLGYFQKSPLEGKLNTKSRDHCIFFFIMCKDPTWIEIRWNTIWSRAWSHMTSRDTWEPVTGLHEFGSVWDSLWTLLLGSHNSMVMTLGSCVKWP